MPTAETDARHTNAQRPRREGRLVTVGRVEDVPPGRGATIELASGAELALFHTDTGFYAIENFCPHRGAALADGALDACIVECALHGWRFDLRTGACVSHAGADIERYEVIIETGEIKILV